MKTTNKSGYIVQLLKKCRSRNLLTFFHYPLSNSALRERGSMLVWVVVLIVVMIGMSSLVVDVGFIQRERARMQRACDAAALAGARQLPYEDAALMMARDLAYKNGYTHGDDDTEVTGTRNPDGLHSGWYQVTITRQVDYFLAPIMGYNNGVISVSATASYTSPLPLYISGSANEYGTTGIMNLSCFGPYAPYTYGDCHSVKWYNDGTENPHYKENGYDFMLEIDSNYYALNGTNQVCVQIFDPDTWNVGDATDAGNGKVDEIRSAPGGGHPQPSSRYNTTTFKLFAPDSTPADFTDDYLIAEATWEPGDNWSDMQWITPGGWEFSLADYGYGKYRINAQTTDGSSENGFNLRAGPPDACTGDEDDWYPENGTEITALGNLPINFSDTGTVMVDLGYIPPEASGFDVYVNKFDTDVGAKSVMYYDEYGNSWPGELSGNGTFKIDTLTIPEGYGGGHLYAEYEAGRQDTSVWQLYFDGRLDDGPAELRLVD